MGVGGRGGWGEPLAMNSGAWILRELNTSDTPKSRPGPSACSGFLGGGVCQRKGRLFGLDPGEGPESDLRMDVREVFSWSEMLPNSPPRLRNSMSVRGMLRRSGDWRNRAGPGAPAPRVP